MEKGGNMKRRILALLLTGAVALSAAGCSGASTEESPAPETAPAQTEAASGVVEELRIGTTAANETFTTFVENDAFGKMCYNSFVTAPFWQTGADGEVEPFIVTDWTVSEDSTTITCDLALDQGITWHDGEPLTMEDVLFTFDYNINVRKSSYASYVDHAEQVDEDTISIVLKEPGAYQWLKMVAGFFYVQPKHIWENIDAPKDYRGEDAVIGCGPYRFVSVDQDAQTSYYEAVSDTYLGREVTVKRVSVRSFDSNDALVMALRNGEIQTVATDHCSFTLAQKDMGREDFTKIPGGLPGVETRGELLYSYGVAKRKISAAQMCRVLSENPARLYGLYPRKGVLRPGSDADIVVYDPGASHVIRAEDCVANVDYNPYEGFVTAGGIRQVWLRGQLSVENGKVLVEAPAGKYMARGKNSL